MVKPWSSRGATQGWSIMTTANRIAGTPRESWRWGKYGSWCSWPREVAGFGMSLDNKLDAIVG